MIYRQVLLMGLALGALAGRADAAFLITISQVGTDVVAVGTGSLLTSGLTPGVGTTLANPSLLPRSAHAILGVPGLTPILSYDVLFDRQSSFGTSFFGTVTAGTGGVVGLIATTNVIITPDGYVSGTSITSTITLANQTIAGLGLTPGAITYSYSAPTGGPTLDTITIKVNGAVPEPASLGMLGLALAGGVVVARRSHA